jgi:hypothetical protein
MIPSPEEQSGESVVKEHDAIIPLLRPTYATQQKSQNAAKNNVRNPQETLLAATYNLIGEPST